MRPWRGFTLVEVMLALVIGGMVVLTAHGLFGVATTLVERLDRWHEVNSRRANARRFLVVVLTSAAVGEPNTSFAGDSSAITFATWLPAAGRAELREITIRCRDSRLEAIVGTDTLLLATGAVSIAFDYLLDIGADQTWTREWHSPVTLPIAVRARISHTVERGMVDTILVTLGARG